MSLSEHHSPSRIGSRIEHAADLVPPAVGSMQPPQEDAADASAHSSASVPQLERLLQETGVPVLLLDRELRVQWLTQAAGALLDLGPADLGTPIRELAAGPRAASFAAELGNVLDGHDGVRVELPRERVTLLFHAAPLRSEDGSIDGVAMTFCDGSPALAVESILESLPHPMMILDAGLRVVSANAALCEMLRVKHEGVLGTSLSELAARFGDASQLVSLISGVASGGGRTDGFEFAFESALLGRRVLLVHARSLPRDDKRILITFEDITNHRRILSLLSETEAQQQEQEHLRLRQMQLNNALRVSTVGELATGLAHELNQPLASISNVVEACTRHVRAGTVQPDKLLDLLAEVAKESMRAAGIVAHLRSFIEKGEPQLELVDLAQIVGNVPHLLLRELERARIALRINLPADRLPIRADRIQIEQVLVNLIQNAMESIQEADRGDRLIELGARATKRTGEVSIRDTGAGISQAVAERMFEAFFTTKKSGLGMGLALSRSILEAHRGRIWFESPDDGRPGTVVRFAVPLSRQRSGKDRIRE